MTIQGVVITLLHCGLASVSFAQNTDGGVATSSPSNRYAATGDWAGVRTRLQRAGIVVEGTTTLDISRVGSDSAMHRVAARNLSEIALTAELGPLIGVSGVSIFAALQSFAGPNGSDFVGDVQGFSNIDAERFVRVAEAWSEVRLAADRVRVKIGNVDANSEFAAPESTGLFLNSSGGFSPTIFLLPTYPEPALSINAFVQPASWLQVGVGVFDGGDDTIDATARDWPSSLLARTPFRGDRFWITQVDLRWHGASDPNRSGRLAIGRWHHTGTADRFDGTISDGTGGIFLVAEQHVGGGADLFLQYGHTDRTVSAITRHFSFGFARTGTFRGRADDALGVMISAAGLSDASGFTAARSEVALEMYYHYQLTPYIAVKPDLQYIAGPAGLTAGTDPLVGTVRLEVSF
jgi:porin